MIYKLALITGASSGIGEALAYLLASKGIPLLLTGRDTEKLRRVADRCKAEYIVCDLAQDREVVLQCIRTRQPDLVINNAGYGLYGEAAALSIEEQLALVEVNIQALSAITLTAIKNRLPLGSGIILNVSSVAGEMVAPWMAFYAASKAFVTHLSQSLDEEYRAQGIRVLVHLPGQVATPFASRAAKKKVENHAFQLSSQEVADSIFRQIQKRKGVVVFSWPYKLLLFFYKMLIPKKFIAFFVKRSLIKRVK